MNSEEEDVKVKEGARKALLASTAGLVFVVGLASCGSAGAGSSGSADAGGSGGVDDYSTLFSASSQVFAQLDSVSAAASDLDGDGDQDILLLGQDDSAGSNTYLYRNDGGVFTELTSASTNLTNLDESALAVGEIDTTVGLDVVMFGREGSTTKTEVFSGAGTAFSAILNSVTDVRLGAVELADMDEDGNLDVIISGEKQVGVGNPAATELYINELDGPNPGLVLSAVGPASNLMNGDLVVAELDGQTGLDLINTGRDDTLGNRKAILYTNFDAGAGVSWVGDDTEFDGVVFGSIGLADVDGDSDTDVLITGLNASSDQTATLYLNDGNGNFTDANAGLGGVDGGSAFGDVDNDGDPDLVLVGTNTGLQPSATLYINDGNGNFSDAGASLTGVSVYPSTALFVDTDGDTDLDLLIAGDDGTDNSTTLYINSLF